MLRLWQALKRFWRWLWFGSGHDTDELARRLGMSEAELLAFRGSYREVKVLKRSGGQRRLCIPDDRLKALQRRILRRVLAKLKCHPAATGFQRGQSIVTHARQHVGRAVIVRLDLKDFFPATKSWRVWRYFRKIGWNRPAAALLVNFCTHRDGLPQGAPTSPRLSNLVNYRLDCRIAAMAKKLDAGYSRYADDMTLSFDTDDRKKIRYMIRFVRRVVHEAGYVVHGRKKMHIRRQHQQQCVTGLVVNDQVNLPRKTRRWLRAVEHHLRTGRDTTLTPAQLAGWRALQAMVRKQAGAAPSDRDRLQGRWRLVAIEERGRSRPAHEFGEMSWTFTGDKVLFEQAGRTVEASYQLGPRRRPRTIQFRFAVGADCIGQGVYLFQGDDLKVGLSARREAQPRNLTTTADSLLEVFVFQRER